MSDPDQIQARLDAASSETYAVTRLIGVGGMAMVFLALDTKHTRQVAIKVSWPELLLYDSGVSQDLAVRRVVNWRSSCRGSKQICSPLPT